MDLISHRLRPTEINEEEFGDFFAGLTSVQVKPHVRKNDNNGSGSLHEGDGNSTSGNGGVGNQKILVIVCILLIIGSFFYICYRIYMDCFYSPFKKPKKLDKKKKQATYRPFGKKHSPLTTSGRLIKESWRLMRNVGVQSQLPNEALRASLVVLLFATVGHIQPSLSTGASASCF